MTCDSMCSFNTKFLKSKRYLSPGMHAGTFWWGPDNTENSISILSNVNDSESWIRLEYNFICDDTAKERMKYSIRLTPTHCQFGGKRWWLICPLTRNGVPCQKRVSKLYGLGKWFGCRTCGDFAYDSQYEKRIGYFGTLGYYYGLRAKLTTTFPHRIKYWKGLPTKRHRRYLVLYMRATGAIDMVRKQSKKMTAWLNKQRQVK